MSGPASLQASLYWNSNDSINIDLLPQFDVEDWLTEKKSTGNKAELKNILAEKLPRRFAEKFADLASANIALNQLTEKKLHELAAMLHNWTLLPAGTVGYRKAEVTRGGVNTDELSSKTMAAKKSLVFILSAKWSTSQDNLEVTTSSGPGLPALQPVRIADRSN